MLNILKLYYNGIMPPLPSPASLVPILQQVVEMLIRTLPMTLLQIFCKILLNYKVIVKKKAETGLKKWTLLTYKGFFWKKKEEDMLIIIHTTTLLQIFCEHLVNS